MQPSRTIITIDGPAGAGKSTVAKMLAQKLEFTYVDTGAMYRALTFKALNSSIDLSDEHKLVALAQRTKVECRSENGQNRIYLDGMDVTDKIRTQDVTEHTQFVAQCSGVRKILVGWQREYARENSIVMEGRDVGTVVFPNAQYKFYLDAHLNERSRRRELELKDKGQKVSPEKLTQQLDERDRKDTMRTISPLKKAADAIVIDSTALTAQEVVEKILNYIHG